MKTLLSLCLLLAFAACSEAPDQEPLACATPDDKDAAADFTLTAKDAWLEPAEGKHFLAWTFDGDVPGPVLRIPFGQTRRIKLVNESPRAASLHFHGVTYANADDGAEPESTVNPGCAHVYTVTANAAGFWPFHSHVEARTEIARGLFGGIVVPEKNELPADHEFVLFMHQLGIEEEMGEGGEEAEEAEEGEGGEGTFFMALNGRPGGNAEVIELKGSRYEAHAGVATAKVGDRVRWRVVNLSPDDPHTFHVHGHKFCDRGGVVDASGACRSGGALIDNFDVAPAESRTVEYVEDNPGDWMVHCHVIDHVVDGMVASYHVDK